MPTSTKRIEENIDENSPFKLLPLDIKSYILVNFALPTGLPVKDMVAIARVNKNFKNIIASFFKTKLGVEFCLNFIATQPVSEIQMFCQFFRSIGALTELENLIFSNNGEMSECATSNQIILHALICNDVTKIDLKALHTAIINLENRGKDEKNPWISFCGQAATNIYMTLQAIKNNEEKFAEKLDFSSELLKKYFSSFNGTDKVKNNRACNFANGDYKSSKFNAGFIIGFGIDSINLKASNFLNSKLIEVNFTKAELESSNFANANATKAIFSGANLTNSNFENAQLKEADFSNYIHYYLDPSAGILISSSDIGETYYNTQLCNVRFVNANLCNANMEHAVCKGANFKGANLTGVNFKGANLCGANFSEATLTGINFENAKFDKFTKWLDGVTLDNLAARLDNLKTAFESYIKELKAIRGLNDINERIASFEELEKVRDNLALEIIAAANKCKDLEDREKLLNIAIKHSIFEPLKKAEQAVKAVTSFFKYQGDLTLTSSQRLLNNQLAIVRIKPREVKANQEPGTRKNLAV